MKWMNCRRNGPERNQTVELRACLACNCQLQVRKKCSELKQESIDNINQAITWLTENGYRPHNFTIRTLKLNMEEQQEQEVKHEQMQSVRQCTNKERTKGKAKTSAIGIRGSVLTV